jgi:hypothetical protein
MVSSVICVILNSASAIMIASYMIGRAELSASFQSDWVAEIQTFYSARHFKH